MATARGTVHSRAPLRISFAGGGTDVPPCPELYGGAVLSATIDRFAYASATPAPRSALNSPDLDTAAALSGRERLVQSVLDHAGENADVVLHCDAPPGSGLGSSSSLVVALCAALSHRADETLTPYELAERAIRIERDDLEIPGGLQDQYAAAFGGFNFIEFDSDGVLVNPLRLRPDAIAELQSAMLLIPTPTVQRRSSGILTRQIDAYERRDKEVALALRDIKTQAFAAKACLLRGDLGGFAEVLHAGWESKKLLAPGVATDEIDDLYDTARRLGASGGKLLGAGGGGYLLVLVSFRQRGDLVAKLRRIGHEVLHLSFSELGAHAWHARA